jgi:hypothetical protein
MWRKLNDVLFCNYNSTWCYVIMYSAESRSVCVYVHSILFIVSWTMNDCQNTINRFNPGIFCACLKARPGYPTSYVLVVFFFMLNELRWEVIVRLVDISWIVDHHCLNFLFTFKLVPRFSKQNVLEF